MKRLTMIFITALFINSTSSASQNDNQDSYTCKYCNTYPVGLFANARTAKTVKPGKTNLIFKYQPYDWGQKRNNSGDYKNLASDQSRYQQKLSLSIKHGLTDRFHVGVCIPYFVNDFNLGKNANDSHGVGNIAVFGKYNFIKESANTPAVSADFWYYLPTGSSKRSLGSNDASYKITTEISKAWKDFSLHFNPGYTWSETENSNSYEINAAVIFNTSANLKPAIEYNYCNSQSKGEIHDLIPGVIYNLNKSSSIKVGLVKNIYTSQKWKDEYSLIAKFCLSF